MSKKTRVRRKDCWNKANHHPCPLFKINMKQSKCLLILRRSLSKMSVADRYTMSTVLLQTVRKTPTAARPYWKVRPALSHHDGFVLRGTLIFILKSQRPRILAPLHASHQGTKQTISRARQLLCWPGMAHDVTTTVTPCEAFRISSPSHPA